MTRIDNSIERIEHLSSQLTIKEKRAEATAALCIAFEPLVYAMAKAASAWLPGDQYIRDIEDIRQTARIGVLEACKSFDRAKGAFATHVYWSILRELKQYLRYNSDYVRLPSWILDYWPRLRRTVQHWVQEVGYAPSPEELATAANVPQNVVELLYSRDRQPTTKYELWANEDTPESILAANETVMALPITRRNAALRPRQRRQGSMKPRGRELPTSR